MKNTKKKGFTIVELVIVIAVIGILSAVLIPTFSNLVTKAKKSAFQQGLSNAYTEYATVVKEDELKSKDEVYFEFTGEAVTGVNEGAGFYTFDKATNEYKKAADHVVFVAQTEAGTYYKSAGVAACNGYAVYYAHVVTGA